VGGGVSRRSSRVSSCPNSRDREAVVAATRRGECRCGESVTPDDRVPGRHALAEAVPVFGLRRREHLQSEGFAFDPVPQGATWQRRRAATGRTGRRDPPGRRRRSQECLRGFLTMQPSGENMVPRADDDKPPPHGAVEGAARAAATDGTAAAAPVLVLQPSRALLLLGHPAFERLDRGQRDAPARRRRSSSIVVPEDRTPALKFLRMEAEGGGCAVRDSRSRLAVGSPSRARRIASTGAMFFFWFLSAHAKRGAPAGRRLTSRVRASASSASARYGAWLPRSTSRRHSA